MNATNEQIAQALTVLGYREPKWIEGPDELTALILALAAMGEKENGNG